MTENEIKEFEKDLDALYIKKRQFASLNNYALANGLEYIASGTARAVWKLNDDKVIKIAKNKKGIAQNQVEADWAIRSYEVTANWYDVSEENIWIESELCKKAKPSDFLKQEGYTFKWYTAAIRYSYSERHPSRYISFSKPANYDEVISNEESLLNRIYMYMGDFDVPFGDIVRISSYGINHAGQIVLTDYGLNESVHSEFYK